MRKRTKARTLSIDNPTNKLYIFFKIDCKIYIQEFNTKTYVYIVIKRSIACVAHYYADGYAIQSNLHCLFKIY